MSAWEDKNIIAEVNRLKKSRVVLAGLWTSVCIVGPALSAIDHGFEIYVIADACGDVSDEADERAIQRMIQRGVRPMTSIQYLLELQWLAARCIASAKSIALRQWPNAASISSRSSTVTPGNAIKCARHSITLSTG